MDWKTISEIAVNFTESLANVGGFLLSLVVLWFTVHGLGSLWPVLKRLGIGLHSRDIWLVSDDTDGLRKTIADADIFNEKRIRSIHLDDLDRADDLALQSFLTDKSMIVMEYKKDAAGSPINELRLRKLLKKNPKTGLVVLAEGFQIIPPALFGEASAEDNTVIVNARGRLLNDIWNMMATTDPQEKGLLGSLFDWVSERFK